ncbi:MULTISPECIES: type II toxin-antitoxin system RelE/ParE family toxin [Methylobacterium]|uniref:type II toxin-antitoxin system RelE/ParE family toxin n=1 Tax=Methylobacterium TaxID=407 RepID=UPI001EE04796|nr:MULTISPECIES: type II toxin-antitoxin system RelE/ParE family toxin [Methylobacterium]
MKPYMRAMKSLGLGEQAQVQIESVIAKAPDAHPMIRGLRGVRKARFPLPGRGKSGGGRAIYYVAIAPGLLFMMTAYPKNERDDLSPEQRKAILEAIAGIKGVEP